MIKNLATPKFEWSAESLFKWSGYLLVLAIGMALIQAALQFMVGIFGLGAICCFIAAIVIVIKDKFKK